MSCVSVFKVIAITFHRDCNIVRTRIGKLLHSQVDGVLLIYINKFIFVLNNEQL